MDDFLVIDHVSKTFGTQRAVDDVSLAVAQGEADSEPPKPPNAGRNRLKIVK